MNDLFWFGDASAVIKVIREAGSLQRVVPKYLTGGAFPGGYALSTHGNPELWLQHALLRVNATLFRGWLPSGCFPIASKFDSVLAGRCGCVFGI